MKFRIGDKVRFLNENVEGEVSRILTHNRFEVIDSHGFTHITDEKELVRVEFGFDPKAGVPSETAAHPGTGGFSPSPPESPAPTRIIPSLDHDQTLYAAVRLHNEKAPLTTDIDLILVNNTSYSVVFTASRQVEDMRSGIDAGILQPRNEHHLGVFSQDEMYRFNGFEFQFLFYGDGEYVFRLPAVKQLVFSSSDFLDPEYIRLLRGPDEQTLLMPLYVINAEQTPDLKNLLEKYQHREDEERRRSSQNAKGRDRSERFMLTRQKDVDLHIEQLLKDSSGMSNAQILAFQIRFFTQEMDHAVVNRLNKITFIHGVGQGVLKSAIREELKKYPMIRFGDAPPEKYGYGATEVEFF